jgi:hypothetical protein
MATKLTTITQKALVSRHDQLAVETSFLIDNAVHASGETLAKGTLMGKLASGKYRAYAEAFVSVAFANNAKTFTLDPTNPACKHFRVGDVIQGTDGTALGTIATFNPATGVGTLVANSTTSFAADGVNAVRIPLATVALASSAGKLLKDEVTMEDTDLVATGFFEGFFVKSLTTLTAAAMTALGAITIETDEVRLK